MVVEEDIADSLVEGIEDIVGIAEVDIAGSAVEVEEEDIPDMHDTVADIADMGAEEDIAGMGPLVDIAVGIVALPQQGMAGTALEGIEEWVMSSSSVAKVVLEEGWKHLRRQKCLECYSFADLSCNCYDPSAGYFGHLAQESGSPLILPFLSQFSAFHPCWVNICLELMPLKIPEDKQCSLFSFLIPE